MFPIRSQRLCSVLGLPAAACALMLLVGCAGIDPAVLETVLGTPSSSEAPLDEATVSRGLREALTVGVERTVERVSQLDGFNANPQIRIVLPGELQDMANLLRQVGFARQVDDFEATMNRAAEQASMEARQVFVDAILGMTIADAFGILRGGETAATDYLERRTSNDLRQRFRPIIENKMQRLGVYRTYNRLADTYNALPSTRKPALRLDDYLTEEALDGLFHELAKEERKIREDPIARTTELLRRVFGRR